MKSTDEFQEYYFEARSRLHFVVISDGIALFFPILQVLMMIADQFVANPRLLWPIFVARMTTIALCAVYPLVRRLGHLAARLHVTGVFVWYVSALAFLLDMLFEVGLGDRSVVPLANFLGTTVMMTFCLPFRSGATLMFGLFCSAAMGIALADVWQEYAKVVGIQLIATLGLVAVHFSNAAEFREMLRSELALRLRIAPRDLVRGSLEEREGSLELALKPQARSIICLASDWRGYQGVARDFAPMKIAEALGRYYDECRALLARHFPSGSYYCDWIADELQVVILVGEANAADVARQAMAFGRDLIATKHEFHLRHALPRGIDVGIAAGVAMVGLAGPRTNPKMMAIGRVPLVARTLQTEGKRLRKSLGDHDRLIFDDAFSSLAGLSPDTRVFAEAGGRPLHYEQPQRSRAAA